MFIRNKLKTTFSNSNESSFLLSWNYKCIEEEIDSLFVAPHDADPQDELETTMETTSETESDQDQEREE